MKKSKASQKCILLFPLIVTFSPYETPFKFRDAQLLYSTKRKHHDTGVRSEKTPEGEPKKLPLNGATPRRGKLKTQTSGVINDDRLVRNNSTTAISNDRFFYAVARSFGIRPSTVPGRVTPAKPGLVDCGRTMTNRLLTEIMFTQTLIC